MARIVISLLFSAILTLISLYFLYLVVRAAINRSEVVMQLRMLNDKLNKIASSLNDRKASETKDHLPRQERESGQHVKKATFGTERCPACDGIVPLDSKICPACGVVLLDEER